MSQRLVWNRTEAVEAGAGGCTLRIDGESARELGDRRLPLALRYENIAEVHVGLGRVRV